MLSPVEWSEAPEMMEELIEALDESHLDARYSIDEPDGYGGYGYIIINHNGRRFRLSIEEEHS